MAACGKGFGGHEQGVKVEDEEDLYAVLGLNKDCSNGDLRAAYKKLALRWHPDRCAAKDSKAKFQAIQEAYSVLSDSNKRFLYDFGVYDDDDDQIDGDDGQYTMCDFMGEMAVMMQQNKPKDNAEPSFQELQALFFDMFNGEDADAAAAAAAVPTSFGDSRVDDELFDVAFATDDTDGEADFYTHFSSSPFLSSSAASSSPPYVYSAQSVAGSNRGVATAAACDPVAADVAAGFSDLFNSVTHAFFGGPSASESGSSTTWAGAGAGAAATAAEGCGGTGRRAARKQRVSLGQDVTSAAADAVSAASC